MDEYNSTSATRVFLSYSHKDKEQKDQVKTCLKALPPGIEVKAWEDTRMLAGDSSPVPIADTQVLVLNGSYRHTADIF